MAYKVIILYRLYMPPYFLGTFTEYPFVNERYLVLALLNLYFSSLNLYFSQLNLTFRRIILFAFFFQCFRFIP